VPALCLSSILALCSFLAAPPTLRSLLSLFCKIVTLLLTEVFSFFVMFLAFFFLMFIPSHSATWNQVSGSLPFGAVLSQAAVLNGRPYVFSGFISTNDLDVWGSSDGAVTWQRYGAMAGPPRHSVGLVSNNDQAYMIGGRNTGSLTTYDDVFVLQRLSLLLFCSCCLDILFSMEPILIVCFCSRRDSP
jgi:hypothetical protein